MIASRPGRERRESIISSGQPGEDARAPLPAAPTEDRHPPGAAPDQLPDDPGLLPLLKAHPDFRRLWTALSFSSLGDWLGLLATTALAAQLTGLENQGYAISGVLVLRLLPAVIIGPLAGAIADRFDRRRLMVSCDVVRALLFISIPVVGSFDISSVAKLYYLFAASFLIESLSLFWIPAKEASVPNLVAPHRLEAANTLSLITTYGSAPVAAAIFTALSVLSRALASAFPFFTSNPVDLSLYANGLSFAFSAYTVSRLRSIRRAARATGADGEPGQTGLLSSILEGWSFIGQNKLVRGLVLGILGAFAAGGCVVGLARVFVGRLGGGDAGYGVLFGAVFLGMASGMFIGPRLLADFSRRRLFAAAIVGAGTSLAILSVLPNLVLVVIATLALGMCAGIGWVVGYTLLQRTVEDDLRGRTFAFVQSMVRVVLLVVVAAAPALSSVIGNHRIELSNGSVIRADGATIILFCAGLLGILAGLASFRQLDDKPGVGVFAELWAALRGDPVPVGPRLHGLLIAVEGGEGTGKSTQVQLLCDWLRESGREVVQTREPGGTELGRSLRGLLLHGDAREAPSARTEALLYAADRAQHIDTVIRPALDRAAVVVTDRYIASSLAYQGGGRELGEDEVARLSRWATGGLRADLTVLLDLPVEEGLRRARGPAAGDRLESESQQFHARVKSAFLELAARDARHWVVVDALGTADQVGQRVRAAVVGRLPGGARPDAAGYQQGPPASSAGEDAAQVLADVLEPVGELTRRSPDSTGQRSPDDPGASVPGRQPDPVRR